MLKKLLLASMAITSSVALAGFVSLDDLDSKGMTLAIAPSRVSSRNAAKRISLFCDEKGFVVKEGESLTRVHSYDTDKLFRAADLKDIAKYACFNKFKISKFDNGEYSVQAQGELKGGGTGGATFGVFLGQALVWGTCHSVAGVATVFGGPTAGVAVETAISTASPFIEAFALKVSLGLGIFFGAATGPV